MRSLLARILVFVLLAASASAPAAPSPDVTKGMLPFIRSEHELAAVLAHEVAHTSFRHQMELMRRGNQAAFLVILAAIITRDGAAAPGAHLGSLGRLAGDTRDMERQADLGGRGHLARSPHKPVAAVTVTEQLR